MRSKADPAYRENFRLFLKEYKRHAILWDTKHPDYNNRKLRDYARAELGSSFDLNESQVTTVRY